MKIFVFLHPSKLKTNIMKKTILSVISICIFSLCFSQNIVAPSVWLRADSAVLGAASWRDVSGNGFDATPSSGTLPSAFSRMNFNKCFEVNGDLNFGIPTNGIPTEKADAIIVYETMDSVQENGLWSLQLDSTSEVGLTSHRILSEHGGITYDTTNSTRVVTNYLSQSWKVSPNANQVIHIGIADSIPFKGRISEFVIFDKHLEDTALTQWLSYLGIKYGVTLRKSNYLDSKKQCVWNYEMIPAYSYSIAGVGRDDLFGLCQKQTLYADGHITFGLGFPVAENQENTSSLSDGEFIVIGMDSNALQHPTRLYLPNDEEHTVIGRSIVQCTGGNIPQYSTFIELDRHLFGDSIRPVLIIDHSGTGEYPMSMLEIIQPDTTNEHGNYMFYNLHWDADGNGRDAFCISVFSEMMHEEAATRSTTVKSNESIDSQSNIYLLTPNPSQGRYRLEIELSEISDVSVSVNTSDGKSVRTMSGEGSRYYVFEGFEDTPGLYLVEIVSRLEHKTLKMIIQ